MLNLNNLAPNELFVRIYYSPNFKNETDNVHHLKEISSRLAHTLFLSNTDQVDGRNIGVHLVNGGVVRRQFRDYTGLVMVINEKYAFQDEQNFFLTDDGNYGKYTDSEYYNCLNIFAQYIALIPGTKYVANSQLGFTNGFVWKSSGSIKNNFKTFTN
jgi:hypothetical protein